MCLSKPTNVITNQEKCALSKPTDPNHPIVSKPTKCALSKPINPNPHCIQTYKSKPIRSSKPIEALNDDLWSTTQNLTTANELNPEVILAAQIVPGLFVLIITLFLALLRFQQDELVLELISESVGTLVNIVVLLLQIIHNLHQIISMAHEGFQQVVPVVELIGKVVGSLVSLVVLVLRLIHICRRIWSILTARQLLVVANDH